MSQKHHMVLKLFNKQGTQAGAEHKLDYFKSLLKSCLLTKSAQLVPDVLLARPLRICIVRKTIEAIRADVLPELSIETGPERVLDRKIVTSLGHLWT